MGSRIYIFKSIKCYAWDSMLTLTYMSILEHLDHSKITVKILVGLGMNIGSRIGFCKFFRTVMLAEVS